MNITIRKGNLEDSSCDLLVVNVFRGWKKFETETAAVDKVLAGELQKAASEDRFKAGSGEILIFRPIGERKAKRVLLVGLGDPKEFDLDVIREVSAVSHAVAKKLGSKKVVSILHGAGSAKLPAVDCARAQVEGVILGEYEFNKLKKISEKKQAKVEEWTIVTNNTQHVKSGEKGVELGLIMASGTIFARDLVNEPAQEMTPSGLAKAAMQIAADSNGKVKVKVYTKAEIVKMKMGGLLGVSQGSLHAPVFVHMQYKPVKAKKRISIVGKAVTFDSGGLSLKPAQYMETMKCDMAGSASVLGAFSEIVRLAPNVHVDGIFAACENMPSGTAIRPGDVLRAKNGKTMEVLNTDAEGRLTLADSLCYASGLKPDYLLDLATLTGACVAALGEEISGLMGNNEKFNEKVKAAAAGAGEKIWELPLEKKYKKLIQSKVADVQNIGGKYGGAITAGLFLQEFVDAKIPWVHIDIAGPAFAERPINSYTKYGGTGAGVATLFELLRGM